MIIIKRKVFFFYLNEEKWLNEMAEKGLHLVKYSFLKYQFERGEPGKYEYRLELLKEAPTTESSQEYIAFLKEAGIECVDTFSNWAYFRKEATNEPFEIYTDVDSKIQHLNRIMLIFAIIISMNLLIGIVNSLNGITIGFYISMLNFLVVLGLTPILLKYAKMKRDIQKNA